MQSKLKNFRYFSPKEQLSYILAAVIIIYQLFAILYHYFKDETLATVLHMIFIGSLLYFIQHYIRHKNFNFSAYGVLITSSLYFIGHLYLDNFALRSYFFPILLPIGTYLILSFKGSLLFTLSHYTAVTLVSWYGYYILGIDSNAFGFIPLKVYAFIVTFIILFGMIYHITISENYNLLRHSNHKKKVALSEIHHRIKNNLGVISSMLSIQKFGSDPKAVDKSVAESQSRIKAVSLIHKLLYKQKDFSSIDFESYVDELSLYIIKQSDRSIKLHKDIEPLNFPIKTMQHFGIILNELLTNSIKYAFEHTTDPQIHITLKTYDDILLFVYRDNGQGCEINDFNPKKSLGRKFIQASTEQLKGKLHIDAQEGFRCEIELDPALETKKEKR